MNPHAKNKFYEWKTAKLGDVAEIIAGGTPSTEISSYWNGDIPWITPKDLSGFDGVWIKTGSRFISKNGLENSSAKLLPKNSVLFSSRAPIGYVAIAANSLTTNQGFKNVICDEKYTHFRFIFYWLKRHGKDIERQASGATFGEANATLMRSLELRLPPIEEQRAIAAVLSSLDDKIELLQRQNKTLEQITQAIFKEWFIEYNFPDKNGKPYKASGGKMIDSELGKIPEGWKIYKLEQIADISIGRTPPRKEDEWFSSNSNDVKWMSVKDLGAAQVYINKTNESLTKEAVARFNIPMIPSNTVVVSFKLTMGRVAITTESMLSNEAIAHIKPNKSTWLTPEYFYLFMKNFDYSSLGSTSSIATAVNSESIRGILIRLPMKIVVNQFQVSIQPIFSKILENVNQMETLSRLRTILLPKLMSGQLRVK